MRYTSADRPFLVNGFGERPPDTVVARKRARIVARRMNRPFVVETEHGDMDGEPGDWLATNHPDDDPGSDVWPISAARFAATYEVMESGPVEARTIAIEVITQLEGIIAILRGEDGRGRDRHLSLAIGHLEDAQDRIRRSEASHGVVG